MRMFIDMPDDLHMDTAIYVAKFAAAMAVKLHQEQQGVTNRSSDPAAVCPLLKGGSCGCPAYCGEYLQSKATERPGWKWVPIEPTEKMLAAETPEADRQLDKIEYTYGYMEFDKVARDVYRAMVAAAPDHPSDAGGQNG